MEPQEAQLQNGEQKPIQCSSEGVSMLAKEEITGSAPQQVWACGVGSLSTHGKQDRANR